MPQYGFMSEKMAAQFGGSIYTTPLGLEVQVYQVTTTDDPQAELKRMQENIPDAYLVGEVVKWCRSFGQQRFHDSHSKYFQKNPEKEYINIKPIMAIIEAAKPKTEDEPQPIIIDANPQ